MLFYLVYSQEGRTFNLKNRSMMKTQFKLGFIALAFVAAMTSCDNENAELIRIDSDPTASIVGINSGLVEGQDFSISLTFNDGAEGSTISTLASVDWSITSGGASVASGSEELSGDNDEVTITTSPLPAGNHLFNATVYDSNGNSSTITTEVNVVSAIPDITGNWKMEPVAASLAVGPSPGSAEWWFIPAGDVATRACFYDDVYTFNADGTFSYNMGAETWLETWQGVGADQCGTPVGPFDGSGDYTYIFTGSSLRLIGTGAHLGLSKVNNQGEISQGAAVASEITYSVDQFTEENGVRKMKLIIEAGTGVFWTFLLISE